MLLIVYYIWIYASSVFYILLEACVPYFEEACMDAAKRLDLDLGGEGYTFVGDYSEVGCYAYASGMLKGLAFYGTGGTIQQMQEALTAPKYRPNGYDCLAEGK